MIRPTSRSGPGRGSDGPRAASPFLRLLVHARPYWPWLLLCLLLELLAVPLALLQPLPIKLLVDDVIGEGGSTWPLSDILPGSFLTDRTAMLAMVVVLLVLVRLLARGQVLAAWISNTWTAQQLLLSFRSKLFWHAQRMSIRLHDQKESSESAYRVLYDAASIQHVAIDGVIPFVTAIATFSSMVLVTAFLSWKLALVGLGVAPILIVATHRFSGKVRNTWKDVKRHESSALSLVQQSLAATRVVRSFGREDHEDLRFREIAGSGMRANISASVSEGLFGLVVGTTLACGLATVLWIGGRQVLSGELSLGSLLLVFTYMGQVYEPLRIIAKKANSLQSSLASAERAFELIDSEREIAECAGAEAIGRSRGELRIEGMSFGYSPGRNILERVSLDIPAGTRVGIQGPTGAGKSTLFSLLLRFYDPQEGRITLDGTDIRDLRLADLRQQFSIVLQEPVLFRATILENIAYARPDAGEEDIVLAAKAAGAHDFIMALPDGYGTVVGERGAMLSGGERQRISIARAYLKDAPILLLDEPTSSIDTDMEREILGAMWRLMEGRTSLMIAHRTSTLDRCDLRIQVRNGSVAAVRESRVGEAS